MPLSFNSFATDDVPSPSATSILLLPSSIETPRLSLNSMPVPARLKTTITAMIITGTFHLP